MKEIAILEYRGRLIVSLQFEITDSVALGIQETVLQKIERTRCRGLVIDVSALDMVDTYITRILMETAHMARLMNTQTVIVGLRPEVALTLIQMGFGLHGVYTAPDLERGMELLDELEREAELELEA